ncbi:hypothetical protein [Acaryochloris sp. IP29b_bin.148]|uniref:hypothetical protein n=1 Tax=Acaryochloris sp. IP29b_bin.148 TaxID=2969218 RepID=UPI00263A1ED7|nr:hypothetical protein [Acaryochloris sp. IP29b_bin.148]
MNPPADPDPNLNCSDPNPEKFADDPALVNFLQRYQPEVPAASPDLEDRILNAVLDEVTQSQSAAPPPMSAEHKGWKMARWGIPAAIAATITLLWGGSQIWRTAKRPIPSERDLEAFVADSWMSAFDPFNDVDTDVLADPGEWWGQPPSSSVLAEANTNLCKRSSSCHE